MSTNDPQCKNCVTFASPKEVIGTSGERLGSGNAANSIEKFNHSTYRMDYPGHKRISPPLIRRPHDALPIATDYICQYLTTCQERFRPWDIKTVPRYENKKPIRRYIVPEVPMTGNTSYTDDFAAIPLPDIQRMSRNMQKKYVTAGNIEAMQKDTTYKQDFGTWKVSIREIPPWAKRKERLSPPPFIAITTQQRDFIQPEIVMHDKAIPYRPKDGYNFIRKDVPMDMSTMYSCIHDRLQQTKETYA